MPRHIPAALFAAAAILAGCDQFQPQTGPQRVTPAQQAAAEQDRLRALVQPLLASHFADPYSLVIPHYAAYRDDTNGEGVCFRANARNPHGAYTGEQWYVAFMRAGRIYDGAVAASRCAR